MAIVKITLNILQGIYTSEKHGNDEIGDGSESKPFKTVLKAMRHAAKEPFPIIYQDSREDGKKYEPASKTQLKKAHKIWIREQKKNEGKEKKEEKLLEDEEKRLKNLEEAKTIVLDEDKSLAKPKQIKIKEASDHKNERVTIYGWVHRLRRQGMIKFILY